MPETLICAVNGAYYHDPSTDALREMLAKPEAVAWLDIHQPNDEDFKRLHDLFDAHPLAIEDIKHGHNRPKVEQFEQHYFLIFYALIIGDGEHRYQATPVYIFAGLNYLVTVHPDDLPQIAETMARWQHPEIPPGNRVGAMLHGLLDTIVDDYFPLIDRVADEVEELEDTIFEQFERSSIQTIFNLKRDLLALRRLVAPERDVINILLRRELPLFQERDLTYLQDVYDHVIRITDNIDNYRDLLSSALDSYLSVEASRQNQILKVLTIASIILMTDALIAGIYGMNFENIPELHWALGYPYALGLMAVLSVTLFLFFRRMKWI